MTWTAAASIETARFTLEPLRVEHAAEMTSVLASPSLYEFTGGEPPSAASLRARYERQCTGQSPGGDQGWLNWIIRDHDSGAAVGYVQATLTREDDVLTAALAWLVEPQFQGHGAATEAGDAVLAWLTVQGIGRVQALIHPDHLASARVAERIGLKATPLIRDGERVWENGPDVAGASPG